MANHNSPSDDGGSKATATNNEIPQTPFADTENPTTNPQASMINNSAYSFNKLRAAELSLNAARKDLYRSKSEASAFPSINERSYTRYEAAKNDYNQAADESFRASDPLNKLIYTLSTILAGTHAKQESGPSPTSDVVSTEHLKELGSKVQKLELELKKNNEKSDSLIKTQEDNQRALRDIQQAIFEIQREQTNATQSFRQDLNQLDLSKKELDQKVLELQVALDHLNSQYQADLAFNNAKGANNQESGDFDRRMTEIDAIIHKVRSK
ncbi:hypothetical protein ABW20_dc0103348 [Dactylellina cionopaga]|nr:hypothetical protein ABW20_dc0103348 [Dactylellina cionopaga]